MGALSVALRQSHAGPRHAGPRRAALGSGPRTRGGRSPLPGGWSHHLPRRRAAARSDCVAARSGSVRDHPRDLNQPRRAERAAPDLRAETGRGRLQAGVVGPHTSRDRADRSEG